MIQIERNNGVKIYQYKITVIKYSQASGTP